MKNIQHQLWNIREDIYEMVQACDIVLWICREDNKILRMFDASLVEVDYVAKSSSIEEMTLEYLAKGKQKA